MAEYKGINGTKVRNYSSDPGNPIKGQVWYNETANTLRVQAVTTVGSWSTGNTVNSARRFPGGTGIQTAALIFGGEVPGGNGTGVTESYNGSSWTEVSDLNNPRVRVGGVGVDNTAVLAFGGSGPPTPPNYKGVTESFNGSSWTEVADLNDGRWAMAGNAGIQNAALLFGGAPGEAPSSGANTESWNGSSWTELNNLNTAREENAGAGTYTAALSIAGTPSYPTATAIVEQWNGSSWTEIADVNTARNDLGGLKGGGTVTDALIFGGINRAGPTTYANTESWNGSSWTETTDLNTARFGLSGSGTSTAALAAAGLIGTTNQALTEEWIGPGAPLSKTISTD
tara:strand:+ start:176 stop:1198 length:1023 start_codon:yes stop_codon:yes gene_type:complete